MKSFTAATSSPTSALLFKETHRKSIISTPITALKIYSLVGLSTKSAVVVDIKEKTRSACEGAAFELLFPAGRLRRVGRVLSNAAVCEYVTMLKARTIRHSSSKVMRKGDK